jgi:transcriptional regulator with XRE-family HTH domain
MGRNSIVLLPVTQRHLANMGENLRLARLRRQLSAVQVSERAGISLPTLRAIERGDANVSMGAYASVLLSLGLDKDLAQVGREDELGRKLQDAQIRVGKRAPRRARAKPNSPTVVEPEPSDQHPGNLASSEEEKPTSKDILEKWYILNPEN